MGKLALSDNYLFTKLATSDNYAIEQFSKAKVKYNRLVICGILKMCMDYGVMYGVISINPMFTIVIKSKWTRIVFVPINYRGF